MFHQAIDWINRTFEFPLILCLKKLESGNEEEKKEAKKQLETLSDEFAQDSNGIFYGCIGAIDGLAIWIECPKEVLDPANYFLRFVPGGPRWP